MSSSRSSNDSSWGRRTSLLALSALGRGGGNEASGSKLRKKGKHSRAPSLFTELNHPDIAQEALESDSSRPTPSPVGSSSSRHRSRPSLNTKASSKRPSSVFDSLRIPSRASHENIATNQHLDGNGEPLSAVSTTAPSVFGDAAFDGQVLPRTVLMHGEVQTSAGMFRKKKEYLVLTESHILRYKSQIKASEAWKAIPSPMGKPPYNKQGSMTSISSHSDTQTVSESSGDKDGRVSMRQVVAIQRLDDGKPYFAIEIAYLDEESGQASALTLQFGNPDERDVWLTKIRSVSRDAHGRQQRYMSSFNLEHAARIVERDHDYDPDDCAIYKVVQRQSSTKSGRSSAEDLPKAASVVCLLAIGVHKVHIIQLAKTPGRTASPSIMPNTSQASYGILSLTAVKVRSTDDSFELTFRQPLQKPRQLFLASSVASEIAARLYDAESLLRPECGHRLFKFAVPREVEDLVSPPPQPTEEHSGLDRTLAAYCISYGLNPTNVRYTIDYDCEDAPRFELLPPADTRRPDYGPIALLAIMRSLRYNETFGSISFAGISLDSLNGLHDPYGREYVCSRTKRGTPIRLSMEELAQASLLVQEIRAIAATSKRLRRVNFTNSILDKATAPASALEPLEEENARVKDIGCGIVEALVPLCRQQTTNVDWICLNGIQLSETDLDYLIGAAVDKSCHFRAIELNRCGLNDRSMGLILDALRAQDNTIEAIEIGGNTARLNPSTFDSQLSIFGFIRKLNLSYVPHTSGTEPLLTAETLLIWRLQELRFSGTALNQATIDAVATYLAHPQSVTLHELYFDNAYLSGSDVATLLQSMSQEPGVARDLHLDISQNPLTKDLDQITQAITKGLTPSHFSMRAIEYREETLFRKMLTALTANKTIRYLDISQTALPGDAGEETCRALYRLLAENDTLLECDLSGEDSRLASSKFGPGINDALPGLKSNSTLQSLRIEKQKLGLQGASTLADVLKENSALRELHCANNEIPLTGLTDLVNALIENTTLTFLPPMDDGRSAAFTAAERTMKAMSDLEPPVSPSHPSMRSRSSVGGGGVGGIASGGSVKRGLASVRRSAARTASAYTPSFPALPRTTTSSDSPNPSNSTSSSSGGFSLALPTSKSRARTDSPSSSRKESISSVSPSRQSFSHHHSGSTATSFIGSNLGLSGNPTTSSGALASSAPSAPAIAFSVQDIQTTHRLLSEQWDRQVYRLAQYLQRNWCLLNGYPTKMEVEDEAFERPGTGAGIGGSGLGSLKGEVTPRAEREAYFDAGSTAVASSSRQRQPSASASSLVSTAAPSSAAPGKSPNTAPTLLGLPPSFSDPFMTPLGGGIVEDENKADGGTDGDVSSARISVIKVSTSDKGSTRVGSVSVADDEDVQDEENSDEDNDGEGDEDDDSSSQLAIPTTKPLVDRVSKLRLDGAAETALPQITAVEEPSTPTQRHFGGTDSS